MIAAAGVVVVTVAAVELLLPKPGPPDRSLERVRQAGVLVVGLDPSYPPFEVIDGKGQPVGFDVDLVQAIGQRLGVPIKFVSVDSGAIYDALMAEKLDLILGGISPLPEFSQRLDYSSAYYDDGLVVIANPAVSDKTLGIESGSDADLALDQLRSELPGYQFQEYDDQDQMHQLLDEGKLGGTVLDAVTAKEWQRQAPDLTIAPDRLTNTPYVIAARKSDQQLLAAVNQAIRVAQESGTLAALEQRWQI